MSTLLSALFGTKYDISQSRRSKGIQATLLRTDFTEATEVLVLKGLDVDAIEQGSNDSQQRKRFSTFCLAVSDLVIVNIKGEISVDTAKLL